MHSISVLFAARWETVLVRPFEPVKVAIYRDVLQPGLRHAASCILGGLLNRLSADLHGRRSLAPTFRAGLPPVRKVRFFFSFSHTSQTPPPILEHGLNPLWSTCTKDT